MDYLIDKGVKVDAIITDPPYATTGYSWDVLIPFNEMWDRLLKLIKEDGAIVLFGNEPFSSNLRVSNIKLYRYDWKWVKTQVTGFQNVNYQPLRCYEDVMVFSKCPCIPSALKPMKYYPQGIINVNIKVNNKRKVDYLRDKKSNEVIDYVRDKSNFPRNVLQFPRESILFHPTQKPVNLMEYIVLTYTKENEMVLDFTSGSGSTLLACEIQNRQWIGIELNEKYCDVIRKRIKSGIQLKLDYDFMQKEEDI